MNKCPCSMIEHPLGICPIVVLLGPKVSEKTTHCFPEWVYKFAFPPVMEEISFTPHPLQHKITLVFFILAIPTNIRWYLRVILICISLMTQDAENLLKCLCLFEILLMILFSSLLHLLIWLFRNLTYYFLSSLWILEISFLSDVGLVKVFSHSIGCCFVLLTVSFALQKLLSFSRSH